MSELGNLESAVLGLLAGIEVSGSPLLADVQGHSSVDRRDVMRAIRRLRSPAALTVFDGREKRGARSPIAGWPRLSVFLISTNLRGGDDPRLGDASAVGAFQTWQEVATTLDGAVVDTDRRLTLIDEQLIDADETTLVHAQRYVVDRIVSTTAPTFDAVAIAGAASIVEVEVGALEPATLSFSFPGIDGMYRRTLGTRGRVIHWRGLLRAADDDALSAIEYVIDQLVALGSAAEMVDAAGRTFADCVPDMFEREGARGRHPLTGEAVQAFSLRFTQLTV